MAKHNASVVVAILLTAVGLAFNGVSEPVSSSLAARAVNALISQGEQMECPIEGKVTSVRRCTIANGAAFYVAKLAGGGFVVTSADTEIDPIIAISQEADLVEDPNNPLWVLLTGDMAARQNDLAANSKPAARLLSAGFSGQRYSSSSAARWARLTTSGAGMAASGASLLSAGSSGGSGTGKSKISDVRVSPLLKTKWGQSMVASKPCFNYYTPNHYVCGCTATAGAQILRYHKFPEEEVAPHTFSCYVDHYPMLLTQKGGIYDWDNMPYVPSGNMTATQRKSIGKLTYDVGVAVNDSYSWNTTWGYLSRFVDLCHEWGYAHATGYYADGDLTKTQLKSVLIPNLDARLPVGVRIYGSKKGGHFVVADGYGYLDNLLSVHLNFGWNGESDAWYVLPGKTASGYTGLDELVGNIYPRGPERGGIVSGRVFSSSTSKPVSGIVVTATNSCGTILRATTDARGIYALVLPASEDEAYWGEDYWDDDEGYGGSESSAGAGSDDWDDDDWDDDWWEDEYGYELYYDERNHLDFEDIEAQSYYYEDEDEWGYEGKWVISVGNSSSPAHSLYIWDGKNYYEKNFSVRIFTVKFDPNGGVGAVENRTCNVLGTLPEATRAGYTFAGWFTAPHGGTEVTEKTEPSGNATYYAHWVANPYTVSFNANGGSGYMAPMEFVYDETKQLRPNAFTKNGAVFRGWSLRPGRLVSFMDGDLTMNLTSVSNDVVMLFASWEGEIVVADAGEYFAATLRELGCAVPDDGMTPYTVKAFGLPSGLKLVGNKAVTQKDKNGKKVVVTPANVMWWIEGVPESAVDYATNPPYVAITANGATKVEPLLLEVKADELVDLGELVVGDTVNETGWLSGVGGGWTVSGLPTGLKYATKKVTKKSGAKTVTVAEAYAVYGTTTKAGLFTITAKKKVGAYYETKKYRVLVRPKEVDAEMFGEELADITTMAYEPINWNIATGEAPVPSVAPVPFAPSAIGGKVDKVSGLPTGLAFAVATTYKDRKKTLVEQYGQTIVGTPTKPGTYVVTFTKNITTGAGKNKKTVAKTAQILWTVVESDAELELGFNTAGGVIEGGSVGLKYGDLMAFSATDGATVTASGLPKGIALANLGGGSYAFTGFTEKAGTYLVTVKATLNGKTVAQRMALKVDGLPGWAKGTFNGCVRGTDDDVSGLATITVSSAGKISGKFQEGGTNWTFTASSFNAAALPESAPYQEFACTNIVAKYAYKATEIVKGKKKTVTKYVERKFSLSVSPEQDGVDRGVARMAEVDGSTVDAWQNLWGQSDYKALGKQLFSTKSGKKTLAYRTWASIAAEGLGDDDTLSVKVTTSGAVTATYRFFKGTFDKKGKPQYATYTCATTLIPLVPADAGAEEFEATAIVVFPPVHSVGFPGCAAEVDYHCDTFFARVRMHADASADDDEGGAGHAKVQLWAGGPYWATTNIGAENPEDYGYHFLPPGLVGRIRSNMTDHTGTSGRHLSVRHPAMHGTSTSMRASTARVTTIAIAGVLSGLSRGAPNREGRERIQFLRLASCR